MRRGELIYLAGCDGTGKTTQIHLLIDRFRPARRKVMHVWSRFPFLLSIPLLAFARLRGLSTTEEYSGRRIGYWSFADSRLMQALFPWTLLADIALAAVIKVYLPILAGYTILCDRFALDSLVDLLVGLNANSKKRQIPFSWFRHLIPAHARMAILDLDPTTIRARRPDLTYDRTLERRLELYREIAELDRFPSVSSAPSVHDVQEELIRILRIEDE